MKQIRPKHRIAIAAITVLSAALGAACSDAPSIVSPSLAPPMIAVHSQLAAPGTYLGTHAVSWAGSHNSNAQFSVSAFISAAAGGTISIPGADFKISFPAGALPSDMTITVTALGGPSVAYDFQPHGIQFNKQVIVTQGLANTSVGALTGLIPSLYAAYLPDGKEAISSSGSALAAEIETSQTLFSLSGSPATQLWYLNHFSKYILASGDVSTASDSTGTY